MVSPSEEVPASDETSASSSTAAPAPPRRRSTRSEPSASVDTAAVSATPVSAPAAAPAPPRRSARRSRSIDDSVEATRFEPAHLEQTHLEPMGDATAVATPELTSWRASAAPAPALDPVTVAYVDEEPPPTSWRDRIRQQPAEQTSYTPGSSRYFRQTITKVDLWSVTKLAVCFYLSAMFVTMVALVVLWMAADAAGIIASVEKFFGDLLSAKDFHFLSGQVLRGGILISLVVVALQVVITVIGASFYNVFAELFGGIEIVVREEEDGDEGYDEDYYE